MGALSLPVLSLAGPWPYACKEWKGELGILLTLLLECMAFEGTVPEATGTEPSQSEIPDRAYSKWPQIEPMSGTRHTACTRVKCQARVS